MNPSEDVALGRRHHRCPYCSAEGRGPYNLHQWVRAHIKQRHGIIVSTRCSEYCRLLRANQDRSRLLPRN